MSEHIKELLSDFMDNEINEDERQMIEKHLAVCTDCNNWFRELTTLRKQILATYQMIEVPSTIEGNVLEKIQGVSIKKYSGVLNRIAIIMFFAFGIMFLVTTSPFLTVGLPIFHTIYSIARGLIYAIPSIISAIPYVVEVITVVIFSFIALAVITLRYLVHSMGTTVRAEDI